MLNIFLQSLECIDPLPRSLYLIQIVQRRKLKQTPNAIFVLHFGLFPKYIRSY